MKPFDFVIFHHYGDRHCRDGICAAVIAVLHAQENGHQITMCPMSYDDPIPDVDDGARVLMVDVSAEREYMRELASRCELHVLDHHETARDQLEGLEAAHVEFDLERSGAMMAWNHLFGDHDPPPLVRYVQDRDLWKWEEWASEAINAYIGTWDQGLSNWGEGLLVDDVGEWRDKGEAILAFQDQKVREIAQNAYRIEFNDALAPHTNIPCVNTSTLQSEVVGLISKNHPFAVGWHRMPGGGYKISLRKRDEDTGPHLGRLAELFGGGGHACAAGFTCDELPWRAL